MKTILTIISFQLSIFAYTQVPTTGLMSCYNFDGNANDGFNTNNGTLLGGATTSTALNVGGNAMDAVSLPGTMLNAVTEYTIAHKVMFANFNVNHQSSSNVIFSGASASNDNLMNFAYAKDQLPGGSVTLQNTVFYIHDNVRYEFNNIDLTAGVWYHFTLVRGANQLKFYLDGIEQSPVGGLSVPTLNLTLDPSGFIFGQDQDVLAGGFQDFQCLNGSIDDLLIYNRELTDQEILGIYNSNNGCDFVGNDEIQITPPRIFPNPTSTSVTIELTEPKEIIITNNCGQRLMTKKMENEIEQLDISILKPGMYYIQIDNKQYPFLVE